MYYQVAFWIKVCYIRSMKALLHYFFYFSAMLCWAQQTEWVDFRSVKATIQIYPESKKVEGQMTVAFDILKSTDSIFLDAVEMELDEVNLTMSGQDLNSRPEAVKFKNNKKQLIIFNAFKKDRHYELRLHYVAYPTKAMYFIDWDNDLTDKQNPFNLKEHVIRKQVWTQGQGKYTSNWLPSIDDMNDKMEFDLSIRFNKGYEVIANGHLNSKHSSDSTVTWHYDMQQPMSSYLVALAIGKYHKKVVHSKSGVPLEMYYYPEDSFKVEPTYRYTKQIFDFLEDEIGLPYPWQNYKQVPVKDFLYAGMENTGTTIFTDSYITDSIGFMDKNYVNVNAHELAHQWFGNLVTETSGTHHWLQEGFATYYALLAEKDIFGENYYYWQLYEYAMELVAQEDMGQSTSLLDPRSSSTTFYKKGAWVLHLLAEKVGRTAFKEAIRNYLINHRFKNVSTENFIDELETASGKALDSFVAQWLKDSVFYYDQAMESLEKSTFIQEYLMVDCELASSKCSSYLSSGISDEAKIKVIRQNKTLLKREDFKNSLRVRQAIAQSLSQIPLELKTQCESLLDDASYLTIEAALYNLWVNFPEDRVRYLQQTDGVVGFSDKNIRILWLTLALVTPEFEQDNKEQFLRELRGYTDPRFHFEVRQNAFQYLNSIQACDAVCKNNLKQAEQHHVWQFSKFAKQLLKEMKE